jgi:multicomponent Na+:H+ antiporter subunit D
MLGFLRRTLTITLDVDWFWRRLGPAVARAAGALLARLDTAVRRAGRGSVVALGRWLAHAAGPRGLLGRPVETSYMVLWVAVLLVAYLLVYYA